MRFFGLMTFFAYLFGEKKQKFSRTLDQLVNFVTFVFFPIGMFLI